MLRQCKHSKKQKKKTQVIDVIGFNKLALLNIRFDSIDLDYSINLVTMYIRLKQLYKKKHNDQFLINK
jgi:hypothetical protein